MAGNEINVQIPQNLDPVYSNMIQIAFKDDEFTMMFLHQLPAVNQAKAKAIVSIFCEDTKTSVSTAGRQTVFWHASIIDKVC